MYGLKLRTFDTVVALGGDGAVRGWSTASYDLIMKGSSSAALSYGFGEATMHSGYESND